MVSTLELLICATVVPIAAIIYRRERKLAPTRSPLLHLAFAVLAGIGLAVVTGFVISFLWPTFTNH
jgi:multisubunit Na+/H+ antiporter MnhB subunit